jgi:hypothetical protein
VARYKQESNFKVIKEYKGIQVASHFWKDKLPTLILPYSINAEIFAALPYR